jgi:hypothetical protein
MEPCLEAIIKSAQHGSLSEFAPGIKVSKLVTSFIQVRLHMKNLSWFTRLFDQQPSFAMFLGMLVAMFLAAACIAVAQNPVAPAPGPAAQMSIPSGYSFHESIDVGGRMAAIGGSGAMYDTMVNLQSGPRVLGETFRLHALPGTKDTPLDDLRAFASGFGGDPNNFAKLDFSKSKYYEFSGMFRRDRRYFDDDLLGNPNIPSGQSVPIGPTAAPTGSLAWPQDNTSPFLSNTVRRMTDTDLTLLPLSKVTFRVGYLQNTMEGPSITPSGYQVAGSYSLLLQEYQRNSTDDFTGAMDWKPVQGTKLTFEEQIDHYKGDSYFNLDPSDFIVQESDGTRAAPLITYDSLTPYKSTACDATSMGGSPLLTASPTGGAPIINAACAVATGYLRSQPTRILYPTEILRLQSSSIKNISMNGDLRYTDANMNLPAYYDSFQGLTTANVAKSTPAYRSYIYTGAGSAKREVLAVDYGIVWQASKTVTLEDQLTYSDARQPGSMTMTSETTVADPVGAGNGTINNPNLTTTKVAAGSGTFEGSGSIGAPLPAYFGQRFTTNNLAVSWDATPRATFSLTYRYQDHLISEGQGTGAHNIPIPVNNTTSGEVTIHENGGIFSAALRPANNWDLNGSFEAMFNDNAFTPMGFRQSMHYRVHTIYRPKSWATVSGAFNDLERHNNTNNEQNLTGNTVGYAGPLDHVDHSRVVSFGTELFPNDRYGLDLNYSYSDVYMSDNICYLASASAALPGAMIPAGTACPNNAATRSGAYDVGPAKDFMDAPTQFGSAAFMYSPVKQIHSDLGYRVSSVDGTRFYNDPRDVAGTLDSRYQTPFVKFSWESRPGLIWKADYNFFGYKEGGPSGAEYCSTTNPTPTTPATPVLCSSLAGVAGTGGQTGITLSPAGETAARDFHANNFTLGVHYEF